ncbi:response regulator [Vibrio ishigakensis]|uniref:Response regulator n=1 Tax=Vibrio ishigakensis TaxID=1481914 RepID=A0A0B8PD07_9VIBR|nr:response regulator [Vibrio ishigakensis]
MKTARMLKAVCMDLENNRLTFNGSNKEKEQVIDSVRKVLSDLDVKDDMDVETLSHDRVCSLLTESLADIDSPDHTRLLDMWDLAKELCNEENFGNRPLVLNISGEYQYLSKKNIKSETSVEERIFELLVLDKIDGFSVNELKDAYSYCWNLEDGKGRKVYDCVYRVLKKYVRNEWLQIKKSKCVNRYFQTETLRNRKPSLATLTFEVDGTLLERYRKSAEKEQRDISTRLDIVLSEINKYQMLRMRDVGAEDKLTCLLKDAQSRAILLCGEVEAVTRYLKSLDN